MDKLAFSISEAVRVSGLGRTKLYEEISAGHLPVRKLGSRTLVLAEDLRAFLKALPAKGQEA